MLISVSAQAFPYMFKMSFISFQQQLTPRFKHFRYIPMIKQALKKHGTMQKHAGSAKKIVFLKDNFIYYSYSY